MSEENDPISEISNFKSGTIYNWLPSTNQTTLIFEGNDGSLTAFKAGRLLSSKYYRRLYQVDRSWHNITLELESHDEAYGRILATVQLQWRIADAVAAVRESVRDVPGIIHELLDSIFSRTVKFHLHKDPLIANRDIAERLESRWRHAALETRDFHVVLGVSTPSPEVHEQLLRMQRLRLFEEAEHERLRPSARHARVRDLAEFLISLSRELHSQENAEIPATIYLSTETAHAQVEAAVEQMLRSADLEISHRDDPVIGSWFRNLRARIRNFASSPLGHDAAVLALHATKNALVHTQEAEITAKLLENVGPVIESLQHTEEAVIRAGALLIVKVDGAISVNQLTPTQQQILYYKPQLLKTPRDILAALESAEMTSESPVSFGDSDGSTRIIGSSHEPPALPPAGS